MLYNQDKFMRSKIWRFLILALALPACSPDPEAGMYLKSDGLVEVALISPEKIAFQAFYKQKGKSIYISGKALKTNKGAFGYQGEHGLLLLEFVDGRLHIAAGPPHRDVRLFTGTYDFVDPDYQFPATHYTYQARLSEK
jgi:hypothetical protein